MKINFFIKIILIGVSFSCLLGSCTSDEPSDNGFKGEVQRIELSPATRALADALHPTFKKYTIDVIKYSINRDEHPTNLVTSPLSATILMSLIANGVEEESRRELTDYLGTDDIGTLNEYCQSLLNGLPKADRNVTVNLANSIWLNEHFGLSPNETYLSILDTCFNGESFNYDFYKDNNRFIKGLRNWYSTNTNSLINLPEEALRIDGSTTLAMLLNSIYFKAPWEIFPPEYTKKGIFHAMQQPIRVDMMESDPMRGCPYYKDKDFEVFCLSFVDTDYWLYVILPSQNLPFKTAVEQLSPESIKTMENEMSRCTLTVSIPKFSIKSALSLNPVLKEAGVDSFMQAANLTMFEGSGLAGGYVNVFQNTFFSLNEKGIEAASVSGGDIQISENYAEPETQYHVNVDRPFIFYIKEKASGAWITSGYFASPL